MKTDVITIRENLEGQKETMQEAENFARYMHLTGRDALHVRLLTEEAISLVHGILQNFVGEFWIESESRDDGFLCRICISANVDVSDGQEEQLLGMSTSGRNEDAKGILGKIRQVLRWSVQTSDADQAIVQSWFEKGVYSSPTPENAYYSWSLQNYRNYVTSDPDSDKEEIEELQKSIIGKLADEVRVGIRSKKSEVVIEKFFPQHA